MINLNILINYYFVNCYMSIYCPRAPKKSLTNTFFFSLIQCKLLLPLLKST